MVFPAVFNVSNLNGKNGFIFSGSVGSTGFDSESVSGAGDVNADGIADVIINSFYENGLAQSYVIFGGKYEFPVAINSTWLNGQNGFVINHDNDYKRSFGGGAVSAAGDVNADGISDVIIGDSLIGQSYVIFGSKDGFPLQFNVSSLDSINGFTMYDDTHSRNSELGTWVSGGGDINADGISDVIVSDPGTEQSYVLFGSKCEFFSPISLSGLNGRNGFTINQGDGSVSSTGDVNNDGVADIIGASFSYYNRTDYVIFAYVIFGSKDQFPIQFNLTGLNGQNGFTFYVNVGIDSVSSAGDINADGIDDIIIGVSGGEDIGGQSYVIFGSKYEFPAVINSTWLNGQNGFVIDIESCSVSSAGDINADGIDDITVGQLGWSGNSIAYVIFGSKYEFPAVINSTWLNGQNGFAITGPTRIGVEGPIPGPGTYYTSVSGAGDVNADGIADIIMSNSIVMQSYVIFGQSSSTVDSELAGETAENFGDVV